MARVRTNGHGRNGRPVLHEAAHKLGLDELTQAEDDDSQEAVGGERRVLHEAAHKLETFEAPPEPEKPPPRVFETEQTVW